jgi:hypothetical protein
MRYKHLLLPYVMCWSLFCVEFIVFERLTKRQHDIVYILFSNRYSVHCSISVFVINCTALFFIASLRYTYHHANYSECFCFSMLSSLHPLIMRVDDFNSKTMRVIVKVCLSLMFMFVLMNLPKDSCCCYNI